MKKYFAYIRVSTVRQGEHGVSLQEQEISIKNYAAKHGLHICQTFEEQASASKRGRPIFNDIITRLKKKEADGLIAYKLDRTTRNLKDWVQVVDLLDDGMEYHLAGESFDVNTRAGRLMLDMLTAIAADFSRNNSDTVRSGQAGRLRQGLYPFKAPIGYVDNGCGGQMKTIHPIFGPLVRQAFELYATGKYSLKTLRSEMFDRGLKSSCGKAVSINTLNMMLKNPFYHGTILIRRTGKTYSGKHEPLISKRLFRTVQDTLKNRPHRKKLRHDYLYRRTFKCASCGYGLVGERQKQRVYYRCHIKSCTVTTIREDKLCEMVETNLQSIHLDDKLLDCLKVTLKEMTASEINKTEVVVNNIELQISNAKARQKRLTELFLDGHISKEDHHDKQNTLSTDISALEDKLQNPVDTCKPEDIVEQFLELAESYIHQREAMIEPDRREILQSITSNRTATAEKIELDYKFPWTMAIKANAILSGADHRDELRTFKHIIDVMLDDATDHLSRPDQCT